MAELKFEEALSRLEKVVQELEVGELTLDDSLKRYEEGIKLAQFCMKKLDEAKKKVEVLVRREEGRFELRPFEPENE